MKLSVVLVTMLSAGMVTALLPKVQLSDCLATHNVPTEWQSSPNYTTLAKPFNTRLAYEPYAIVLPNNEQDVQNAVTCAKTCGLKVQAKSGGHSYASFSSGGKNGSVEIFLENFNQVSVDKTTGIASVGGGVRLGNVANNIYEQDKRALPHGTCPGVGVGGHSTHGGYGHVSREYGLMLDTIVAIDIVLADGSLVHATNTSNPDIFWACRGACDSFGIVTRFYYQTHAAPDSITYFAFPYSGTQSNIYETKETYVNTFLHIQEVARNTSVVDNRISWGIYEDGTVYNIGGAFDGTPEEFNKTVLPEFLRSLPAPDSINVTAYSWIDYLKLVSDRNAIVEPLYGYDEHDDFFAKSLTVPETDGFTADTLGAKYDYIKTHSPADLQPATFFVITNLYGGPGSSINAAYKTSDWAAYSDRESLWVLQLYGHQPGNDTLGFINGLTNTITSAQPQTDFGAYLNYVDPSLSADEAHKQYYGEDLYNRLLVQKQKYDPDQVFWNPQAIGA